MRYLFPATAAVLTLTACTSMPTGPTQMALPGTNKNFDQFRLDDSDCRQYSQAQIGDASNDKTASSSGVKSAAVGTGVGAIAGAAIGGNSAGAATGAGLGLIFGAVSGVGAANRSTGALQNRYDVAYTQCMYAKGHRVAVAAQSGYADRSAPPPPVTPMAPPLPGSAAPPPLGPPAGADQSYSR